MTAKLALFLTMGDNIDMTVLKSVKDCNVIWYKTDNTFWLHLCWQDQAPSRTTGIICWCRDVTSHCAITRFSAKQTIYCINNSRLFLGNLDHSIF